MRSYMLVLSGLFLVLAAASPRGVAAERNRISTPVRTVLRRVIARVTRKPAPPVRLMSTGRETLFRRAIPRVDNPQMTSVLNDPELILYTHEEMPGAYQFWDGLLPGVHAVSYNISAEPKEPYGNGNREFPWGSPAGTHRTGNVSSFRFVRLPRDVEGRVLPVVWYRDRLDGDRSAGYAWTFPVGTVFGEVLAMRGPDGRDYTFELRTRTRVYGAWEVDVFRPFPTAESLSARIKELRPGWNKQPKLAQFAAHLDAPHKLQVKTLADRIPRQRVFVETMGVDNLPPIDDDRLVAELLSGATFRSAAGEVWSGTAGATTSAPTTSARFHIVPAAYDAGFISVDSKSCQRCHDSVNRSVDDFDNVRDWYGRIRGSDGIFSFHPFSLDCISHDGSPMTVRMRKEFEQAGILAQYDPKSPPERSLSAVDRMSPVAVNTASAGT